MPATWNSLEIMKLVVAALTPIAVAAFGFWISRQLKRLEQLQWASQKAVEKRLEVYSELAPTLNDLYCYFDFIGHLKQSNPDEVFILKRTCDKLYYVHAALFSMRFKQAYSDFIDACFIPGPLNEYDSTAKIRTDITIRKPMLVRRGVAWKSEWDDYFAPPAGVTPRDEIVRVYWAMMDAFVQELGVELQQPA